MSSAAHRFRNTALRGPQGHAFFNMWPMKTFAFETPGVQLNLKVTEKQEVAGCDVGPHPPQALLEANQVAKVSVNVA